MAPNNERTKYKAKSNGYRSNFIGLDLTITLKDGNTITLPIECQIQTIEQYKDGKTGSSSHSYREGKSYQIKNKLPEIMPRKEIYRSERSY